MNLTQKLLVNMALTSTRPTKRKRQDSDSHLTPSKSSKKSRVDPIVAKIKSMQNVFHQNCSGIILDTSDNVQTGTKNHDYYIDGVRVSREAGYYGVTTYIHNVLFKEFNKEEAWEKVRNSPRHSNDPRYRYFMKSKEEVFAMWEQSGDDGSDVHDRIDEFFKMTKNPREIFGEKYKQLRFCLAGIMEKTVPNCYIFASEVAMADKELKLTGCIDALFYNPATDRFVLLDWKANSVKTNHYGSFGIHPTSRHMPDTKYHRFHCQLNMYALMLRRVHNIYCEELYIVGFGLDKLMEKPLNPGHTEQQQFSQLLCNLDVHKVPLDLQFQSDFISNRLAEISQRSEMNDSTI